MGKKGTKRKTKWRALPLGEEAGGSGNEEDLLDEDQSTTSSIVGGQPTSNNIKRQSFHFKMADKPYRQTRRFTYDRFRSKEPLVKLESKTFDEEEYTKITTPRQDVLFKKGYFGRKRESSVEETAPPTGEMDGEEPMMDQIIITNGFVDERGHYLVNGNSYEIYDPYSNTVTVVVGPPPYANGVTQPVLAAVSCQPVPLQPVDWFPPAADWPSQGSAWTPTFPRNPHSDSLASPDASPGFANPDAPPIPNLYNQAAYVVPGYGYGESPVFNGVPLHVNLPTEAQNSEENALEVKKTRRKSTEYVDEEKTEPRIKTGEENSKEATANRVIAQNISEIAAIPPPPSSPPPNRNTENAPAKQGQTEFRQVEKQSHSTQTNLLEATLRPSPRTPGKPPGKESHSTQTPPEETFRKNDANLKPPEKSNKNPSDIILSSLPKTEVGTSPAWKPQGHRFGNSEKIFRDESPKKIFQQRTNFGEERRANAEKVESSPVKVSYAKKAMTGLENANPRVPPVRVANGRPKSPPPLLNGTSQPRTMNGTNQPPTMNGTNQPPTMNGTNQPPTMNGTNQPPTMNGTNQPPTMNGTNQPPTMNGTNGAKHIHAYEEKRNGFVRARYGRGKSTNERTSQKYKGRKLEPFEDPKKKCEVVATESRSQSEKSSTVSELSSPTELSSGQNTPPEKLIVQKMEEEINKSFEEKLKQNLSKGEEEKEEPKREEKPEEKPKGKKKKNKPKPETEKRKETGRSNKKKKKRAEAEAKEKFESDNSSEEIPFLSNIRQREIFFGSWEEMKGEGQDFISDVGSLLNGDKEILKSLGLNDDRISYSKLPLHSDLLMMLPAFGWSRPKLKIEDFFAPSPYQSDLFTKRNITNMKSTKPEEFFASVIDGPTADKSEKKREPAKKPSKPEEAPKKSNPKTGCKVNKSAEKKASQEEEEKKKGETEVKEGKLGIVEAVNTWLQEQGDSEKFAPVESFENLTRKEENSAEETDPKNGPGNPIHAPCRDEEDVAGFREGGGCIRVANVINDGFIHVSREFQAKEKPRRMYRSSSWDAKLSEVNIKKHFKFLTESASFCQDLISDVRNGLPPGNEYATEELCDPKQTVTKYYILAPNGRLRGESDSENEVFDALEYKFLKENQEADGKGPDGNGNASITDSGVHSDMESSEDYVTEHRKETACKLQ